MSQAENVISFPTGPGTTDKLPAGIGAVSRRAVLGGGAAAVLAAGVAAQGAPLAVPGDPDARFWALWHRYQALVAEWSGDPDENEAVWDAWGEKCDAVLVELLMIPVGSARAVWAKWQASDGQDHYLPAPVHSSHAVIGWDLERLARAELLA